MKVFHDIFPLCRPRRVVYSGDTSVTFDWGGGSDGHGFSTADAASHGSPSGRSQPRLVRPGVKLQYVFRGRDRFGCLGDGL